MDSNKFRCTFSFLIILLNLACCFSARTSSQKKSKGNLFDRVCGIWYENDPGPPKDIEHCPLTLNQAKKDSRFSMDTSVFSFLNYYHKGAVESYRQSKPNANGSGQQCVYTANGSLLVGPPYGSSADLFSPVDLRTRFLHIWYDVAPWEACCKRSKNKESCTKYFIKRPSDDGSKYQPQSVSG